VKAFWKYTVARMGLFAVVFVAIWAATNAIRPQPVPFILVAAFIVSGVISIFALRGMREEVATQLSHRAGRDADDLD
jgi:cation transporter-like permease